MSAVHAGFYGHFVDTKGFVDTKPEAAGAALAAFALEAARRIAGYGTD